MATQPVDDATRQQGSHPTYIAKARSVETTWFLAFALIVLTFAAYQPLWRAGFIWDDNVLITGNRMVTASGGLYRFWFTTESPDYYPLTSTLWWLEWRMWGDRAVGYHVVNVLLHAVNAVLVWIILRRLRVTGAWLAASVFSVHPVNVASVAWVSEQKNTLSMLLSAVAILQYLKFDEVSSWRWYWLSLICFLLALLSKTAVVMLPVVLLGCVWWLHGQIRWKDFLRVIPFFVLSLILGLVTIWFQYNRVLRASTLPSDRFVYRLASAGWVPWFYLCKALLPVDLMVIYPKWKVDASSWISYVPGTILLGSLVLFWSKRKSWGRPILFGLLYFVVMLFPVLGFFEQGLYRCSLVADHWQYYSIIGIIALTTAAGEETSHRIGRLGPKVGVLAGAAILMMLAIAAWTRACIYRHDSTLWQDNLAKNPNAWLAHNNLGHALVNEGDFAGATWHYEQALRLEPDYADAHNNLGNILLRSGKVEEAIGHFERAVQIEPDWAVAHNSLGSALLQEGKVQEAVDHLERAVRSDPNYAEAHYNLGNALLQQGKYQEAIECYRRALALKPEFAQAHHNLAVLLEADRPQEAIAHYEEAVRLYPGYTQAHYNLAMLLANQGRIDEAISHLQTALKLEPESEKIRRALDEMGSGKSGRGFLR